MYLLTDFSCGKILACLYALTIYAPLPNIKKSRIKLNISLQNINWTKKSGILIIGITLIGMLMNYTVQFYRGTWIYQYGSMISLFVFYGGIFWSLINTILLISKHKTDLKNNLIWILLSAIPFIYIGIMMTIAMTKTIE